MTRRVDEEQREHAARGLIRPDVIEPEPTGPRGPRAVRCRLGISREVPDMLRALCIPVGAPGMQSGERARTDSFAAIGTVFLLCECYLLTVVGARWTIDSRRFYLIEKN